MPSFLSPDLKTLIDSPISPDEDYQVGRREVQPRNDLGRMTPLLCLVDSHVEAGCIPQDWEERLRDNFSSPEDDIIEVI